MQKLTIKYFGPLDTRLDRRLISAMAEAGFVLTGSGYDLKRSIRDIGFEEGK